jgi:peptidoglycan/LPS O-acetylase OafA/YrhL
VQVVVNRFKPERWVVVALDAARALAAIYVVIHHICGTRGVGGPAGLLFRFGQEAVTIFFVLSGSVIFMNEYNRVNNVGGYALRRVRRIYPALVASFIISIAVAFDNGTLIRDFKLSELLGNVFALQDVRMLKPGVWVDPFLGNSPLWSLSYEVIFYILFPGVMVLWRRSKALTSHAVGLVSCLAYVSYVVFPNHLSLVLAYFQIWWFGAMVTWAAVQGGRSVLAARIELFWTAALCAIAAGAVAVVGYKGVGYYPFLQLRHFALALLVVSVFFGPIGRLVGKKLGYGAAVWSFLASISYGLYLFHYPIVAQWRRPDSAIGLIGAGVLLVALAWLVDRKFNAWLPRAPVS